MEHDGTELATAVKDPLRCQNMALRIEGDQLDLFFPMLQRGVTVQAEVGRPLKDLLCTQFGIPEEYVTGRITTIFLDNRPVDDLDRSLIHEGSRVTLSAAMPGLVGATMRRSGFYAALRQGISHAEKGDDLTSGQGTVRLKLFNLLLPELAPLILARGILLEKEDLDRLLKELKSTSRLGVASSYFCGRDECGGILVKVIVREPDQKK
jgi:hypothetical protein